MPQSPASSRRFRSGLRTVILGTAANLLLVIIGTAVGLGLFEVGLRTLSPVEMRVKGTNINLHPNQKWVMDGSAQPKFDPVIVKSTNSLGLRGEAPPNYFDRHLSIIAIGGSTTECYYLSDEKTWPFLLGKRLQEIFPRAWVNNAGMDGQTSFGHLHMLEQHIVAIRPKVVLIMMGINDQAKSQASLYDGNITPQPLPDTPRERVKRWLSRNSELYALALTIIRSQQAIQGGVGHGNLNFSGVTSATASQEQAATVLDHHRPFLPAFGERARQLSLLARRNGIEPIFVTQTAIWGEGIDPTTGKDLGSFNTGLQFGQPTNGAVSWQVLELYNETVRQVAAAEGDKVVDLARLMPKDSRYFYDWYHLSNEGAAKVADILARDLCPHFAAKYPDQSSRSCPTGAP